MSGVQCWGVGLKITGGKDVMVVRYYLIEGQRRMQQLFDSVVSQFQSQHQYDKFIKESEKEYDIKIYRLHSFTIQYACVVHAELKEKYESQILSEFPQGWHQNERRLYIWFIVCFIHMKLLDPIKFVDADKYQKHWKLISQTFWQKDPPFLKYQLLNIIKTKGRTSWKKEEETLLTEAYHKLPKGQWNEIAKYFYIKSRGDFFKTPKQCRERWQNHLNESIKHGQWTDEEDRILFSSVRKNGQKWANIISLLHNTRTEHMIKNRFKSILKKITHENKMSEKQAIDFYLRKITNGQFKEGEEDNLVRDERYQLGIVQVESENFDNEDGSMDDLSQKGKKKKKRGRKPKKRPEEEVNLSKRQVKHQSIKQGTNNIQVKGDLKQQDNGSCIIEGLSNSKKNLFLFNHSINLDHSRGYFDSIHSNRSGLFNSGLYSLGGQGFTIPPVEEKSITDGLLFPERESLRDRANKVQAQLDGFLVQRQSLRSRNPSILYPNDSFMSGFMR